MGRRYYSHGLTIACAGLALQLASIFVAPRHSGAGKLAPAAACLILGFALLIVGLAIGAKAKRRSPLWGIAGLLSVLGLFVVAALRDRRLAKAPSPQSRRVLHETLGPYSHSEYGASRRPYTEEELDELFGPAGPAAPPSASLVGNDCAVCGARIADEAEAKRCPTCSRPVHLACRQPGLPASDACPACGGVRELSAASERIVLPPRPRSVTIIAAILILNGFVSLLNLAYWAFILGDSRLREQLPPSTPWIAAGVAQACLRPACLFLCASGLLRRRDWARYLFMVWGTVNFGLGMLLSEDPTYLVKYGIVFLVISTLLFQPSANRYFRPEEYLTGRD